jgi:hypothetical protein
LQLQAAKSTTHTSRDGAPVGEKFSIVTNGHDLTCPFFIG